MRYKKIFWKKLWSVSGKKNVFGSDQFHNVGISKKKEIRGSCEFFGC
ncbi:hypothetical protein LBBP_04521 (plasmid) [Leptospira borgpetersenii serovar Ballum]|uniref:Uncharacterized protein n=1 Tax=Leptospira borgpetersenii serovar Ballum TaxID=280505 RepID=A0A0S2IY88_LEPBO|nr:hypothetical protein LBBP_00361 [Leptospira borgpetersenii serovar Ballum]ALO28618.1 hypothetical protein LBBP_04521 [Leptospira borgpetersenii serovar Ballum]